ncbi:MAG: ABC transporter ATP-binding protein [Candidatus Hodarchaeota archaeon]
MLRKIVYDPTHDVPDDLLVAMFNVYKIFRTKKVEHVALRGVSLGIHKGEIVGCIGPSGSGKTTLLRILAGLSSPTAGTIYWSRLQSDLSQFTPSQLAEVRNKFIGYISQIPFLLSQLNILNNVMFAGLINDKGIIAKELRSYAIELLKRVGLADKLKKSPKQLSGGEIQRVALASALINKPDIVFADEPTGNLDFETGEEFLDLLEEINESIGTAFFMVTHSSQVAKRTPRVLELSDGMIIGQHSQAANLAALNHTRMLIPDAQNRIHLPEELMAAVKSPWGFSVEIDQEKVILNPVVKVEDIDTSEVATKTVTCSLCSQVNQATKRFCDHCGSFLSRFKFFAEE